ncbi:hypothetical protein CAP47_02460 [Psychroflexus sp. S27]|uniref:copper resistance protein NlpE n=1 Tax=Psychroflexus sp. S27 TaxID=1982757 RepID=UPI000C299BD2|nr:copper resistance protein NlpE [Psychroflexus sp. S27]PJX25179.1 hypothetical protein CAP47_02460 [Psychroflexus sp. S27]
MKNILMFILVATLLSSCTKTKKQEQKEEKQEKQEEVIDNHTSQISLDWAGTYQGVIPCADCPGIEMTVKLSEDQSIEIKSVYQDKDTEFIEDSEFEWLDDGLRIYSEVDKQKYYFKIEENQIVFLDQEGNKIDSDLNYTLKKQTNEN